MSDLKILKVNPKIWWGLFIVVQFFILVVMIGTLTTPMWIELNPFN